MGKVGIEITEELINIKLCEIFNKIIKLDFENNIILREAKLLGKQIQVPVRDFILILYEIEKEFNISIPKKEIINGKFDSYQHIMEIVMHQRI